MDGVVLEDMPLDSGWLAGEFIRCSRSLVAAEHLLLLENHGALVCGATLPEAYIYHHFFELACRAQIGALAGGGKLIIPGAAVCTARAAKFGRMGVYNADSRDWVASMALVEKLYPEYKT